MDIKSSRYILLRIKNLSNLKLDREGDGGEYLKGWDCTGILQSRSVPHTICEEGAEEYLNKKIEKIEGVIKRTVSVPLTQDMFDSLVSYIHSIGTNMWEGCRANKELNKWNYCLTSQIIRNNYKNFREVCTRKKGRREIEADLFLTSGDFILNLDKIPKRGRMANNLKFDRKIPKYRRGYNFE